MLYLQIFILKQKLYWFFIKQKIIAIINIFRGNYFVCFTGRIVDKKRGRCDGQLVSSSNLQDSFIQEFDNIIKKRLGIN